MAVIDTIWPQAVLPGAELEVTGSGLGPLLTAEIGGVAAQVTLARANRARLRVAEGSLPGDLVVTGGGERSGRMAVQVGVAMAENVHPVANPAVDSRGNVYTTLSGPRGQQTPVAVFKIAPAPRGMTHEVRPFVREILNATGLAFSPKDGDHLYVSSRADGIVYRVDEYGVSIPFAEGLGVATGIAFDQQGDLYVGDRSGTIFRIRVDERGRVGETYVFATLESSISAYHLGFNGKGMLYVTGPTTASSQAVYEIDPHGKVSLAFRGLGRAQGFAFDVEDNLYVAASLRGDRGIVRIAPSGEAKMIVSGANLIGLCFLPGGGAALATRDAVFEVELGIRGLGV